MEEMLWNACDALRGSIELSEYKHIALSLIFLKYVEFYFNISQLYYQLTASIQNSSLTMELQHLKNTFHVY